MSNKPMYLRARAIVQDLIQEKHRGTKNAIKKRKLLKYILVFWPDMPDPDRTIRRILSELPVITGPWGACWPEHPEDLDKFSDYMKSKAIALFARAKKVAKEHPELLSEKFIHQLGLYDRLEKPE